MYLAAFALRWLSRLGPALTLVPLLAAADAAGPSSRRTSWVLSEIHYHPAPRADSRDLQFVEIYNAGLIAEDLGGHRLSGDIHFTVPANTIVPAGGFVVIAPTPADVQTEYGLSGVLGGFAEHLVDAGSLRLSNPAGAVLLEVKWNSQPPWPAAASGPGSSLVLTRPSFGENDPRAWSASARFGGSPGQAEPTTTSAWAGILINEILAHTDDPQLDFVELYNHTRDPIDLSECQLTDHPTRPGFRLPAGSILPAGGWLAFDQNQLGFALSAAGETLVLYAPERRAIIDAVKYGPQANGVAYGRFPDGSPYFRELQRPTAGAANTGPLARPIVINEILYHPISGDSDDEFVELLNRGEAGVDIGGWRFVAGIDFEFPAGTRLRSGEYLVVARNVTRLLATHPDLVPARALGNFRGSLADRGEHLALAQPLDLVSTNAPGTPITNRVYATVAEVTYRDGGAWGRWSDGGGSSLELIDPRADPDLPSNWADSDESAKAPWTTIETTGTLDLGSGAIDQLQVLPLGAGVCLVDDVEVIGPTGNLVANGAFATGTSGWVMQGTLEASRWQADEGATAKGCLRIEAVGRGDTGANRVRTALTSNLTPGGTATLRAKARWLRGQPELLLRLRGNYLEAAGRLTVPTNLGTPGARNSRALANVGPALVDLTHAPVLPAASQTVVVTARAQDPDGIGAVTLRYRVDPANGTTDVPMRDDGNGGDLVAGDGIYSATLPGQSTGRLVAFQIIATDAATPAASTTFPSGEALIRWGEARPSGTLGTYRLWMTQATFNRWTSRSKLDNAPLPVTFAYNDERVVHGVGALFAGSPHISPGYSTPSGNLCGYTIIFPADETFLGATDVVLDWPGRDATAQQEPMAYWIARELGIPFNHRRFIRLHVNGVTETSRGSIYEDAQQVSSDLVESWNPDATGGHLHKIEQWFEFDDNNGTALVVAPRLENYTTTGGAKKTARYRWSWLPRAQGDSATDFQPLFALVDAANTTAPNTYPRQLFAFADLEEWMRIFATEHIVVNLDSWGYDIGKNMYAFKPTGGRWQLHMWDIDWVMLASAQHGYSPTSPLMYRGSTPFGDSNRDPVVGRMYNDPEIQRAYWRAIADAIEGPLVPARVTARMDTTYAALVAQGVTRSSGSTLAAPTQVKTWLAERRTFLIQQLAGVSAPFRLDPPPATLTGTNLLRLTGTAPVAVAELRINDRPVPVAWTTVTNWTATVVLQPGANLLAIQGYDRLGRALPAAAGAANVAFTGTPDPAADALVINEIQYHPAVSGTGFVELFNRSTHSAFDLAGWRLDGVGLEFPTPSVIAPQSYLVVAADRQALALAHGMSAFVAAEWPGQLLNSAETLRLIRPATPPASDEVVDEVAYADTPPWPLAADGTGASLQLIDPSLDNRHPGSWAVAVSNPPPVQSQTLIPTEAIWRYDQTGRDLGTAWREVSFDDRAWPSGGALLYNESAALPAVKTTPLTLGPTTFYFRTTFRFDGDPTRIGLKLTTIVDDGAVVYLNGTEFYRLGLPADATITSTTFASRTVGDAGIEGPVSLPADLLRRGDNTMAVEVHQVNASSTDVVLGLALETSPPVVASRLATPGAANAVGENAPTLLSLWLNEFQADNRSGPRDQAGERDPWVEILNTASTTADLGTCALSDSPTNLTRWAFPASTRLAPGQRLLVWLDGQPGQSSTGELHASFRADPRGGSLTLSQVEGQQAFVLDHFEYAGLAADQVVALLPDGDPLRRAILPEATPGQPNSGITRPTRVFVNEWLAANQQVFPDPADGDYEDGFELYNAAEQDVDLTGCWLSDDPANPRKFALPAGTTIRARGFLWIWADEEGAQTVPGSALHANFKLSQAGEQLTLSAPDGTPIDQVTFGAQAVDLSGGRWPDGGPVATNALAHPTPAGPNAPPAGATDEIAITGVVLTPPATLSVTWTAVPGGVYALQAAAEATHQAWVNLGSEITAPGTTATASDADAVAPHRFYRIIRVR